MNAHGSTPLSCQISGEPWRWLARNAAGDSRASPTNIPPEPLAVLNLSDIPGHERRDDRNRHEHRAQTKPKPESARAFAHSHSISSVPRFAATWTPSQP